MRSQENPEEPTRPRFVTRVITPTKGRRPIKTKGKTGLTLTPIFVNSEKSEAILGRCKDERSIPSPEEVWLLNGCISVIPDTDEGSEEGEAEGAIELEIPEPPKVVADISLLQTPVAHPFPALTLK